MSKLTFYGLVAQIGNLKDSQERLQVDLMKLARTYPGIASDERFQAIEARVKESLASFDELLAEYNQKNAENEE